MRWNGGQEECVRCGRSLISQLHSRDALWKHQLPFTFKFQAAERILLSKMAIQAIVCLLRLKVH